MIKKFQLTPRKSIKKPINIIIAAEDNKVIITTFIGRRILRPQCFDI